MDETARPGHHVARIAQALAPDPRVWDYLTLRYGESWCVCGQNIVWQFILRREGGDELVIGSTCILETVPWLLKMDATALAQAIKQAWRGHLAHLRRQKSHAQFADTLAQATAQAFELDEWWRALQVRLELYLNPPYARRVEKLILHDYWHKQRHGSLRADKGRTTGERAGALTRRIATFRDRIPLLESALTSYSKQMDIGKHCLWIQMPSARSFKDVDSVLPLIEQVDTLRPTVASLMERYGEVLSGALDRIQERQLRRLHERPLHASARMLGQWIELTRQFAQMDEATFEAALAQYLQVLDETPKLKGKLLGLNDSFASVMDTHNRETLARLLKLWRDLRLATLTRWRDEAKHFIASLDVEALEDQRREMDALLLRADALRHVLTDIMNALLAHHVLPDLVKRIRELPLWDTPETLTELRRQIAAFEGEIRTFPGEEPVRNKAREPRFKDLQLNLEVEIETLLARLARARTLADAT